MKIKELLNTLGEVSAKNNLPTPYVCGGAARDFYLGNLKNINDLDVSNGSPTIKRLAFFMFQELNKSYNILYKTHEKGNSSIYIGKFKLDFSSHYLAPNIDQLLIAKGINKPTNLEQEMYSRDFHCNSLLLSLDFKNLIDITKQGIKDLDNKIINTCLDPLVTFTGSSNRVVRAIYMATKLGSELSPEIIKCIQANPALMLESSEKSVKEKLQMSVAFDKIKTIKLLDQMNLWKYIPTDIPELAEEAKKRLILVT